MFKTFKNGLIDENPTFVQVLGMCPTLAITTSLANGIGMGLSVTFVLMLSNMLVSMLRKIIPQKIRIAAYVVIIAALVQFVEMFLQKSIPSLYSALGIYLPLITTNCAVLGVALLNVRTASVISNSGSYTLIETIINGFSAGIGFLIAIVLFAGVRERLESSDIPKSLQGFPIALISASLLAMAFLGFQGMKF